MANVLGCTHCATPCTLTPAERDHAFQHNWTCPYQHMMHDQEIAYGWHLADLMAAHLDPAVVETLRAERETAWAGTEFTRYCATVWANAEARETEP
jgi:hypothetical protein